MPMLKKSDCGDTTSASVCMETFAWMILELFTSDVDVSRLRTEGATVIVGSILLRDVVVASYGLFSIHSRIDLPNLHVRFDVFVFDLAMVTTLVWIATILCVTVVWFSKVIKSRSGGSFVSKG